MNVVSRAQQVSFNSLARGGQIDATHNLLAGWDYALNRSENFQKVIDSNTLGLSSASHVRDIVAALRRRLDPEQRERALTALAKAGTPAEIFKPCLLWHLTLDEFLLRDFLVNWLFPAFMRGVEVVRTEDVQPFVLEVEKRGGKTKHAWTQTTLRRAASSLLKFATDFGFLTEGLVKRFTGYVLPEDAFLYVLYGLCERSSSPTAAVRSPDWRIFLMRPEDVERELLHLHQYKKLEYQVAGSLVQVSLPYANSLQFVERMVA